MKKIVADVKFRTMEHLQESFPCKLLLWSWYINFQYDHLVIKFGGYDTPELPCFQAQSGHADHRYTKVFIITLHNL